MKIAIHHSEESFSDEWITFCKEKKIDYKIVNCYANDIISQLHECDALMWHHHHGNYKDLLFAKQLLFSLEQSGKKVFPDFKTSWHFDDKLGQKYLLESLGAPLVPSYVFYSKNEALQWIKHTTFPKVFKLRCGAGSFNVRLIKSSKKAEQIINKAFAKGFSQFNRFEYFKERVRKYKEGKDALMGVFKGIGRLFIPTEFSSLISNEKGYVYFQDFISGNQSDIRVIVIGEKAFAIKRLVRRDDFRASGSGNILYDRENFPDNIITLSFRLAERLNTQCVAFDFVNDAHGSPLIVEMSYGFAAPAYEKCVGYWDKSLNFYTGPFNPQRWIVENMISNIQK
jgi:glutathione synthase/RimK-type ligase-like ATP-grasp enzyme